MSTYDRFLPDDLLALEALYERAWAIIPMQDVYDGCDCDDPTTPDVIAVRHDCDNVIAPAVQMAKWEYERGYRSTYYILHTSPYWQQKSSLVASLDSIAGYGHEIGIHNDAITVALETGRDPADVLHEAIDELRGYGHEIRSTVAHGNRLCHIAKYVNDEMFIECIRPAYGEPLRVLSHGGIEVATVRYPLSSFGLDFDSNWLHRGDYLSDSGGQWSQPFTEVSDSFPSKGQLHILQHPDWWAQAFEHTKAAA